MNDIASHTETEILKGKRILFVDDRAEVLAFFIEELAEDGVEITRAETLSQAFSAIAEASQTFDLVVIDLHMPGKFPDGLDSWADRIPELDLNEGQALGLWLHETYENIPYLYLSSVPNGYKPIAGDTPAHPEPINKFTESPFDFPTRLAAILKQDKV